MTAQVGPYFDNMEQRFQQDVPPITVHRTPAHIARFIDDLSTDAGVTKPVGDLYIATHAGGDGFLFVRLFRGQVDALGDPSEVTDYEVLDQAMGPSRPGRIPDSLVDYHRGTPPAADPAPTHSVHIKGCNIGRDRFSPAAGRPSAPFLAKLKQVFGGNVNVTAPKHFHGLLPETNHNGVFEYMAQELIVRTKAVRTGRRLGGFATRAAAIAAFDAAQLQYHDGTPIPAGDWAALVPSKLVDTRGIKSTHPLGRTIENLKAVTVERQFRVEREQVRWTLTGKASTPAANRLAVLRASIAADGRFAATHAWPMYERRGFVDFATYFDGHLWDFTTKDGDLLATGSRFDYTVVLPIVDRSVTPVAKRPLVYNFYPGVGSPDAPVLTGIVESDNHFFGRA
jgi:hypothetical protein